MSSGSSKARLALGDRAASLRFCLNKGPLWPCRMAELEPGLLEKPICPKNPKKLGKPTDVRRKCKEKYFSFATLLPTFTIRELLCNLDITPKSVADEHNHLQSHNNLGI